MCAGEKTERNSIIKRYHKRFIEQVNLIMITLKKKMIIQNIFFVKTNKNKDHHLQTWSLIKEKENQYTHVTPTVDPSTQKISYVSVFFFFTFSTTNDEHAFTSMFCSYMYMYGKNITW